MNVIAGRLMLPFIDMGGVERYFSVLLIEMQHLR
jgi:hypothetical protein